MLNILKIYSNRKQLFKKVKLFYNIVLDQINAGLVSKREKIYKLLLFKSFWLLV